MFPSGKMKALTLSYDDGVEQDERLTALLNRYGIRATFNLNSGIQTKANGFEKNGVQIRRMNMANLPKLYAGHEIAVHSLTHPHLEILDEGTIENELGQDKLNLERLFNTPVRGMAYPFGTYDDRVIAAARCCGIQYARDVTGTHSFDMPENLMTLHPTCHHRDPRLMELGEAFLGLRPGRPQLFYVWGHSYEFEVDNNWNVIEDFCRLMGGRNDIFYATNTQALLS